MYLYANFPNYSLNRNYNICKITHEHKLLLTDFFNDHDSAFNQLTNLDEICQTHLGKKYCSKLNQLFFS